MRKYEFLAELEKRLSSLSGEDKEERLTFYGEMVDDRMEDGLSEEEAVAAVGTVDEIAKQIVSEAPLTKPATEPIKTKRKMKAWEIVLLAVGSPVWLSLLIAVLAVVLSLYISLWAVVISLWAVFVSLIACGIAGMVAGVGFICAGKVSSGIAMIASSLVCAGLAIFLFYSCHWATKGTALLAKLFFMRIKHLIIRKGKTE